MSRTYDVVLTAMRTRQQVICTYHGRYRELCPAVLGVSNGREKMLAYQFGGSSSGSLADPKDRWRCMFLDEMRDIKLRKGAWHTGGEHSQSQPCVKDVHYDINPDSPFNPRYLL